MMHSLINLAFVCIFGLGIQISQCFLVEETSLKFADHFQNHMVLQQGPKRAHVYGYSTEIGANISLTFQVGTKRYNYTTTVTNGSATVSGRWSFVLDPIKTQKSVTIVVKSPSKEISLTDVLFGDVWICSGQSNMQFNVAKIFGGKQELLEAHKFPLIRVMTVDRVQSPKPLENLGRIFEPWSVASNESLNGKNWSYFSAICWLYGKIIHERFGYPVGLISSNWGGTPIECWSSPDVLNYCGIRKYAFSPTLQKFHIPQDNSVCWNAMISPLKAMTIYGVIWYQGEANIAGPKELRYACAFSTMIGDWRRKFHAASKAQTYDRFPFGFVQLGAFRNDSGASKGFSRIRWHQTGDYGYVPNIRMRNVFMATALDLPDFSSPYMAVHTRDKLDVAKRLAYSGMAVAYLRSPQRYNGPFPKRAIQTSNNSIVVDYGRKWTLEVRSSTGFEIRCLSTNSSTNWIPVEISTHNTTSVTLTLKECLTSGDKVTGIRYAWSESPCPFKKCAIYSTTNELPAPPSITLTGQLQGGNLVFKYGGRVLLD